VYAEGVRRGGTLMSVRTADDDAARAPFLAANVDATVRVALPC
jgi:hypothetical protein